jgi:4-hydroxy-tetrahydrodipicolinate synthase
MDAKKFFTTLVCPFDADGRIDEAGYRRLLRYFLQPRFSDIGGICVNPEAGEVFYLTRAEKRRLVEIAVEEVNGRMPVVAGTFAFTTSEVVEIARDAKAAGAQGLFVIPPAGCGDITANWDADKYPEVWIDQLEAQAAAVDLPMITHPSGSQNVPLYGKGIPLRATEAILQRVPNIVGWKMTYPYEGNKKITALIRGLDRPVAVLQSGAYYFHEHLANGNFDGTMSGFWNVALEPMFDHIEAWRRGDVAAARQIWNGGLYELQSYQKGDGRLHIRYKIGAWLRGLIDRPTMRAPMPTARPEEIETMYRLMSQVGIPLIDKRDLRIAA